jgi:hypothetical protein
LCHSGAGVLGCPLPVVSSCHIEPRKQMTGSSLLHRELPSGCLATNMAQSAVSVVKCTVVGFPLLSDCICIFRVRFWGNMCVFLNFSYSNGLFLAFCQYSSDSSSSLCNKWQLSDQIINIDNICFN